MFEGLLASASRPGRRDSRARARRTGRPFFLIAALAATLLPPTLATGQELSGEVERLVSTAKLGKAKAGISVLDLDTGEMLASYRGGEAMVPASNMKLLTSGAALLTLGPDFIFRTQVDLRGDRLILVGSGDPALADPEVLGKMQPAMTVDGMLKVLAEAVRKQTSAPISEVIVDDRVFDRELVHPTWPTDQLNRWYCAEVNGLNFHTNVLYVFPRPSPDGPGRPATYSYQPEAPWLEIAVKARTVADGKNTAWLSREDEANRFTMYGEVRFPSQVPVQVTLHNSGQFFGQVLADRLARAGLDVGQGRSATSAVRLVAADERFDDARTLAVVTTSLTDILRRCNVDSHNLYAESLFKRVAREVTGESGSWNSGASVTRMLLSQKLGPEFAAGTNVVDGSGMSKFNTVAPSTFTRWLGMLAKDRSVGDPFINSLAAPGEGTLQSRFSGIKLANQVRAKSGAINNVRCLSGYVINPTTGHKVAFSVMVNDIEGESRPAMKLAEDVVQLVDRWLSRRATVEGGAIGG
ncbi:MAG: D-alanyl-D-alanine carboxypeptidase/D-alanyl-D-alanine-endopeptidase [Phycisphaerales bacterium]|nr:D-alanyl-D-alanine carboxypeptidase/D-alanyl-D-alanine-endopeptidase [Phycisphaerales bacterium]